MLGKNKDHNLLSPPPSRPPRPPTSVTFSSGADGPDDFDYAAIRRAYFLLLFGDAIRSLPTHQQDILDLVIWGRMTMTEVGNRLGLPRTTALDQYKAALRDLRRFAANDPTVKLTFEMLSELFGNP